jgi:hypothetical protein
MGKARGWFGPLSGLLFVAGAVASLGIFGGIEADPSSSASTVLAQFAGSSDDIGTAAFLMTVGVGFLLIFLGHVRAMFRAAGAGWATDAFLAGGVALAGAMTLMAGVDLAGGVAGEHGHLAVAQMAVDFSWNSTYLFTPGLLAMGVSAAAASFAHRAMPTWLGGVAVVVALGALAPWLGILVFVAWVVLASIVDLIGVMRSGRTAASA